MKKIIKIIIFILIIGVLCIDIIGGTETSRVRPINDDNYPDGIEQEKSVTANFPDDYGPIQIDKYVTPKFQDFYIKNQTYLVYVKISGIGRSLDNIYIKEDVPSALQIHSFKTCPFVVDQFDNSSIRNISIVDPKNETKSIKTWNENYSNNSKNIFIKINRLEPKRCIEYEYELIPRMIGTYSDITTVRIGGDASKFPDMENKIEFDVRDPKFEIVLSNVDSCGYVNTPLKATYDIVHESGSSSGLIYLDIYFNNTTKYNVSWCEKSIKLVPFKSTSVNVSIWYKESGLHSFPPIIIDNRTNPLVEKEINIYYNLLSKRLTDLQSLFNSTPFFIMLYGILIYILRKIDNELKELADATIEANKIKIKKYEYEYVNIEKDLLDPNSPHWWRKNN
jgi:hypothetical protein